MGDIGKQTDREIVVEPLREAPAMPEPAKPDIQPVEPEKVPA